MSSLNPTSKQDQRFRLTEAHLRALRDMVFVYSPAEPQRGLGACLLTDPLMMFGGKAPGLKVAEWIGIKLDDTSQLDAIAKQQVVDFYHSFPLAIGLAQQAISRDLPKSKIESRGALAMVMGYGNPDPDGVAEMPKLNGEALQIILDLADDAHKPFASLEPLVSGVQSPVVSHAPSQQQMGLLKSLVFDWTWFDINKEEFAERFFASTANISLMDYLDRIPTISASLPTSANCEQAETDLFATIELSMACLLEKAELKPGEYYRSRETRGQWKSLLRVAA